MAARREGGNFQSGLDPLFMALTLFRHRRFGDCLEICNQLLEKNPRDQVKEIRTHQNLILKRLKKKNYYY